MNRAFLYGDGFFESIRTQEGQIPLLMYHLKRITEALDIYEFDLSEELTEDWLESKIEVNREQDQIHRLSFYRDGEGRYAPLNNLFKYHLEVRNENRPFYIPTDLDLISDLMKAPEDFGSIGYYNYPKPIHPVFTVKSLSSAFYVLAAKYQVEQRHDHLFLLNAEGDIIEELSSNILCLKGDEVVMPPLDSGQVIGACLRFLIAAYGFQISFDRIRPEKLDDFDAVFLSQGSTGVRRIL